MPDPNQPPVSETIELKLTLNHSQANETLFIETEEVSDEVVLSSGSDFSSLTLLEESFMSDVNKSKLSALLALLCIAISISFALTDFKTF
ncbi:MAG TPA: hypothetical protein DCS60_00860 [Opitutae bacterium]|nr:hypothetical protein [Opitutae bacterium]